MLFSGRGYYNLLWLQKLRNVAENGEAWESLDYRTLPLSKLWSSLSKLSFSFDKESFIAFCEPVDSPEELIQLLMPEESEEKNKVYLLIFELWRRLLPEKESVSIFADELDRKIAAYERYRDDSELLLGLGRVVEILESNTIEGEPGEAVFERLCLYVAHDLESVIYTYIDSALADSPGDSCLLLIEHFMPYVKEKRNLQFLKLKSIPVEFVEEREQLAHYLINSLQEEMSIPLAIALLFYLIDRRDKELFAELFSSIISHVSEEKVLVKLLDVLMAYHGAFGSDEKQNQVHAFLQKHLDKNQKIAISKSSKDRLLSFL
ncbi:MAG: hypothetical protein S4CHLAM27_03360 [Chlamydiia bacterium]|nr:hypothetical protein [Chlamydiia bacterium]